MCGICGYISSKTISPKELESMNNTMFHRGPDDAGTWQGIIENKEIGLAHRRLSIIDLSELGHQPMFSQDGKIVVVFNGELYNYQQVRKELSENGYQFVSECDTEVLIAAYQKWGEYCVNKFTGMFAFALYDIVNKKVVFARDRIGKKPLYYYWGHNNLIFASELKAILKFPGLKLELNMEAIAEFLCNQYINAPKTIYHDVFKLQPGCFMIWESDTITVKSYWDLYEKYKENSKEIITDFNECKMRLKDILFQSVKERMVADVPAGTFLSGGIDSTLITALAQKSSNVPVKTYSIGFFDKKRNEAEYAKETAKFLGTEHTELYVEEKDMLQMIESLVYYYDEPFADPSQIPMMLISNLAKQGITVALSGDGGDEFFCGYSLYDYEKKAQYLDGLAAGIDTVLKKLHLNAVNSLLPQEVAAVLNNRDEQYKVQFFTDLPQGFLHKLLCYHFSEVKFNKERDISVSDWQLKRMILDMYTYLPEDVLAKTDRASMKYALEVRCPLLDYRVMEFSFQIPQQYKYSKNGRSKYILKSLLYDYVPERMMDRPKNGFGVPLGKWLRTYLSENMKRYTEREKIIQQGIFHYDVLQELIRKVENSDRKPYPKILWSFYVFQMWYNEYIETIF